MNRTDYLDAHLMQFQRGEKKARMKKVKRKISVRINHILLFLVLLAVLFLAVQKLCLFLLSWKYLEIKDIQIACPQETIREDVRGVLQDRYPGNILLLNIPALRDRLQISPWIKEVGIKKIFPSSLRIEVSLRKPAAFIRKDSIYLIDEEGVALEKIEISERTDFPLLIDENHFKPNGEEKLKLAWACLTGLSAEVKSLVETVDLTERRNVVLQLRGNPTKVILGGDRFAAKLAIYLKNRAIWENQFGGMEYVDLRIPDRIYLGMAASRTANAKDVPRANKEVG
ncbi:MAG: FtsQ-type POTRA domain-containing protein [Candidatus Aminicenantales bacterium]